MKLMIDVLENEFDTFVKDNPTINYEILDNDSEVIPQCHKDLVELRLNDGDDFISWEDAKQRLDAKWVTK